MIKTPKLLIAALSLAAVFSSPAAEVAKSGAEVGKWTQDYAAAAELAKEKSLPILLNFTGSDWNGWCKLMDATIFSKPDWAAYAAESLVLVTIDFPKDDSIVPPDFVARNEALSSKFGVETYPTFIILESDGTTQLGKLGAGQGKTADSFTAEVDGILAYRQSAIEARAAELGEEKGKEYVAAITALKEAEAGLLSWLASKPESNEASNKKFAEFQEAIAVARKKLEPFD
ncbi:MAG: thioredoxin-related protein [Verrucomicrobiales bacterium]|jgi:thioredoxin-related protein